MHEQKIAKQLADALQRRDFSVDLFVHYLGNDPDIQPGLLRIVKELIASWSKNHRAGQYINESDRRVYEEAAGIRIDRATSDNRPQTKRALPDESVWD
jgi:hypothetical protein